MDSAVIRTCDMCDSDCQLSGVSYSNHDHPYSFIFVCEADLEILMLSVCPFVCINVEKNVLNDINDQMTSMTLNDPE